VGRFHKRRREPAGRESSHLSNFTIIGFRELYPDHDARTRGIQIIQVKDFVVSNVKIKDTGGAGFL